MRKFSQWLLKQQDRQSAFVSLYDVFFAGQVKEYFIFRLKYFNLKTMFYFLVHVVNFYLLFTHLSIRPLIIIAMALSLEIIVMNFWWGGLERFRSFIRYWYRLKEYDHAEKLIGFWVTVAFIMSFILLMFIVALGYYGVTQIQQHHTFITIFPDAFIQTIQSQNSLPQPWIVFFKAQQQQQVFPIVYIALTLFSIAIQLPFRTYHSGVYAISRIMRPGFTMIIAELVAIAVLIISWPTLQVWAILLSMLTRNIIATMIGVYYVRRVYRFYTLKLQWPSLHYFWSTVKEGKLGVYLLAGIANVFTYIDALLVVGWIVVERWILYKNNFPLYQSLIIFILIGPLLRAAADWSFLFYFDRKRLEKNEMSLFTHVFNRYINRFSVVMGLFYWLIVFFIVFAFISSNAAYETIVFLPFFILSASIINLQRQAFAELRYGDVIISGVFMVVNLVSAYFSQLSPVLMVLWILMASLFTYLYLLKPHMPACSTDFKFKPAVNFYNWLNLLSQAQPHGITVYRARFIEPLKFDENQQIIRYLRTHELHAHEEIVVLNKSQMLFFLMDKNKQQRTINKARFILNSYGKLSRITSFHYTSAPAQEPAAFYDSGLFHSIIDVKKIPLSLDKQTMVSELLSQFLSHFPTGFCYLPEYYPGPKAAALTLDIAREVNYQMSSYLLQMKSDKDRILDVSVLYIAGVIRVVFVVPLSDVRQSRSYQKLKKWYEHLHSINLYCAVNTHRQ